MRNFIFIAVFVAILAFGTTAKGISLEEARVQDEELSTTISDGITNINKAVKVINESTELLEEINRAEDARLLQEMEEGREEYRQAIEKYSSSFSD